MDVSDNIASCSVPGDLSYGLQEDFQFNENLYKSVVERYYTKRYKIDHRNGEDICILEHSNRICLVTLAPSHPIMKSKKSVTEVSFKIDENINRSNNKVTGRLKRGAQWLNKTAVLCKIKCTDGTEYNILPGIKANLVEINEKLLSNPNLVVEKPDTSGYMAIILTKHEEHQKEILKLSTEEKYLEHLLLPTSETVPKESLPDASGTRKHDDDDADIVMDEVLPQ